MAHLYPEVQSSEPPIGQVAVAPTEVGDIKIIGNRPWVWNSAHSADEIAAGQNVRGSLLPNGGYYRKTILDAGTTIAVGTRVAVNTATTGGAITSAAAEQLQASAAVAGQTFYDFGEVVEVSVTAADTYDCLVLHAPDGTKDIGA